MNEQTSDSTAAVLYSEPVVDSMSILKSQVGELSVKIEAFSQQISAASSLATENTYWINNTWMLIATALVFVMHLGFATLESGLTRAKNTSNILFKNTVIPALGIISFALVGFSIMFPNFKGDDLGLFGFSGFGMVHHAGNIPKQFHYWTFFLFQAMFAATSATIVSGAVAERIKLISFLIFTLFFVSIAYPLIGSWVWGGGWLSKISFHDFAGSTVVHAVGGCAALAGALILGPRTGKFDGQKINPIPGHSMTSAVVGVFMLWLGWFGFNGGSVLSANPEAVGRVLVSTSFAASVGAIAASVTIFALSKTFDLSMTINGILAGLVGITAGADVVGVYDAMAIGLVSGILVVFSVLFFEWLRIDDPVGAISVHCVCGIWGTIAVGIFGDISGGKQVVSQLVGVSTAGLCSFAISAIIFLAIKYTIGLRVPKEIEQHGLDHAEHGMSAYSFITK